MPAKRLPASDEERIKVLNAIIVQEELAVEGNNILSAVELHDVRNLLLNYEGSFFCFKQALDCENAADKKYVDLYKTAQLYISHFIQVLNMAVIRNEIRKEALVHYELENAESIPDLSTEEALLAWGEHIIKGEAERTYIGGAPIYNPAIAKVKVHYDLFNEGLYSLTICRKNTVRCEGNLSDVRKRVDEIIWNIWSQVETRFWDLPVDERKKKFRDYQIGHYYQAGEQLSVFG